MPIRSVEDLRRHLTLAMKVELTTVPPYLFAMYSIEDQSSEAARLIKSVVAEEMLHAALVANLLLAVGGRPDFSDPSLLPTYPGFLPHHEPPLRLELSPCSQQVCRDVFMVIEQPESPGAPPEDDRFETLGQFYLAVELALERLAAYVDLFADHQPECQLSDPRFYAPVEYDAEDSGGLLLVHDLASARRAIETVVHQGEGITDGKYADPAHQELTHYYKFEQIASGASPLGRVRPVAANPKTADLPEAVRPVAEFANAVYRYLYLTMDELFRPAEDKGALVDRLYGLMSGVLRPVARYLTEQPVGGGMTAGPTFEVFAFQADTSPADQLRALGAVVMEGHPSLHDAVAVLDRF